MGYMKHIKGFFSRSDESTPDPGGTHPDPKPPIGK